MAADPQSHVGYNIMGRYTGPSCKLCFRINEKLFLKGEKCFTKCTFDKKKSRPTRVAGRESEYAKQLKEKQKLKYLTCLTEKQFRNYYRQAEKLPGKPGENLLLLLAIRLDNVVKLSGFAPSIRAARQLVLHGKIKVNDKKISIPGYKIKPGDKLSLDERLKEDVRTKNWIEKFANIPSWININKENFTAEIVSLPNRAEIPFPVDESLIVEFYSK